MRSKNRYLVFAGPDFYPGHGAFSLAGAFDDIDAARQRAQRYLSDHSNYGWCQVLDVEEMKLVFSFPWMTEKSQSLLSDALSDGPLEWNDI